MSSKASHSQGVLLFKLNATQLFAMGTLKVKELVRYSKMSKLPNSHPTVIGTATIRSRSIPIIDMAKAVGYRAISEEELKDSYIIITDCQRKEVGFLVRGIDKIINCNWKDIKPPPSNVGRDAFLTGVTQFNNKIVQLLDVELLLSNVYPDDAVHSYPSLTDIQREMVKPLNILLVDDSRVARKQLSDALNGLNIPYKVATNGQEALDVMKQSATADEQVHLLVSDIEMPGLDGYELAFEVKNTPHLASAYIILHTSLSSEISVSQAHQVGANEALTKFDATELIEAILRGAQHHYELESQMA
ncbi:chemotaxis protein [Pseudoalteromonas denitrificans]|uniref:Response regulator receiver modulated CheW protein n=1 Tax=Pseudoalteromonas denitrificans DSM 6059 TaxID=1123010 RepID=A0A1I1KS83_9GAMM|nr:chemotaxis protein [Pseudoalteromonas denitrificans]SFC61013.1 response regulator receiver modulated CheW protein [Pseudoalteromonas denitrificans DSM 6059]